MNRKVKALMIAGTGSGRGKTTCTVGIILALKRKGLKVQAFKTGPDFIDTGHLTLITGRQAHNLDTWMTSGEKVKEIFCRYSLDADVAVVEGAMGLFDGKDAHSDIGSSAHIAKLLGLPVILVVDASSMSRSAAAIIKGFAEFDPGLELSGVLLNRVGSDKHERILRETAALVPQVPLLGILRRNETLSLPSRHLGLITAQEGVWNEEKKSALADWACAGIDSDSLISMLPELEINSPPEIGKDNAPSPVRIAVAIDRAFCFHYAENLRLLHQAGTEIIPFSPLEDHDLPENIHAIYLAGGYPEVYAQKLSANKTMLQSIRRAANMDMPIYAECGGFIYLGECLENTDGTIHRFCGVFNSRIRMEKRFQALGYREVKLTDNCILGKKGTIIRGHEFHYSRLLNPPSNTSPAFEPSPDHREMSCSGFRRGNILGSYIHLHFSGNSSVAETLVQYARNRR